MSTNNQAKTGRLGDITLLNVRLSYPKLVTAQAAKGSDRKRFGAMLMIPKDTDEGKALYKKCKEIEKGLKAANPDAKIKSVNLALADGDDADCTMKDAKGYWYVSANRAESQGPPQVVDKKRKEIAANDKGFPYPGCMVNAVVSFFFTKNGGSDRIACSLEIVQFRADGERLGGGSTASVDDLPEIEDDEPDGLDKDKDDDGFGDLD